MAQSTSDVSLGDFDLNSATQEELLLGQEDLDLLTPDAFAEFLDGVDEEEGNEFDDGMDDAINAAVDDFLSEVKVRQDKEVRGGRVNIVSDITVREGADKETPKLRRLLTLPRVIARDKTNFYAVQGQKQSKPKQSESKPKRKFTFRVPTRPIYMAPLSPSPPPPHPLLPRVVILRGPDHPTPPSPTPMPSPWSSPTPPTPMPSPWPSPSPAEAPAPPTPMPSPWPSPSPPSTSPPAATPPPPPQQPLSPIIGGARRRHRMPLKVRRKRIFEEDPSPECVPSKDDAHSDWLDHFSASQRGKMAGAHSVVKKLRENKDKCDSDIVKFKVDMAEVQRNRERLIAEMRDCDRQMAELQQKINKSAEQSELCAERLELARIKFT